MLIINADDWGRSEAETDAALACFQAGRITSATAMVFMRDSERAAAMSREHAITLGLHVNLNQSFEAEGVPAAARAPHEAVARYLSRGTFALLCYHPGLRTAFRQTYRTQRQEFDRLHGRPPSHVDGHQHRHLCANMLLDRVVPPGTKLRRNFSFRPGEKGVLNRTYRRLVDGFLGRHYRLADHFFSLERCLQRDQLDRVARLARQGVVELMTHPVKPAEREFLLGPRFPEVFGGVTLGTYADL